MANHYLKRYGLSTANVAARCWELCIRRAGVLWGLSVYIWIMSFGIASAELLPGAMGSQQVFELNRLAQANLALAPSVSLGYARQAVERAVTLQDSHGQALGLLNVGLAYLQVGDRQTAGGYLEQSLTIARQASLLKEEGDASNFLGTYYLEQGMFDQALKNYLNALKIRTFLSDQIGISKTTNNLGRVSEKIGDYQKALDYYEQSLASKGAQDPSGKSNTLNNMAMVYRDKKEYEQALKVADQALAIAVEINYVQGVAYSRMSKGEALRLMGRYSEALENALQAISRYEQIGYRKGIALALYRTGLIYEDQGQEELARAYYQRVIPVALEIGQKNMLKDVYYRCARMAVNHQRPDEALMYYDKYKNIGEEVLSSEMLYRIMLLQTNYEIENKEREIELLKRQGELKNIEARNRSSLLGAALACLFVFALFTIYLRRQIADKHKKEQELLIVTRRLEEANERLNQLAETDFLTKLANRRNFDQNFPQEYYKAQKAAGPLSVVMVDVDFFKQYNDIYGHPQGDICLKKVAAILQEVFSGEDILLARYGGDEFVIAMPLSREQSAVLSEKARKFIEQIDNPHRGSQFGRVTCSFGIASLETGDIDKPYDLLEKADKVLYKAKAEGRNRVNIY